MLVEALEGQQGGLIPLACVISQDAPGQRRGLRPVEDHRPSYETLHRGPHFLWSLQIPRYSRQEQECNPGVLA